MSKHRITSTAAAPALALAFDQTGGAFGPCPFGTHQLGVWDTSFTGGSEGVSCRRCHKTWLKISGVYTDTYSHNATIGNGKSGR